MSTYTGTSTFSRFSLLKLQVMNLLDNAAHASKSTCEKISKGLDGKYIEEIAVIGLYPNDDIGAELRLKIDWREHEISIKAGGESIQAPSNWVNGISPSLNEAIQTFTEACKIARLKTEWVICYCTHFNRSERYEIDKKLGFKDAPSRKWRNEPQRIDLGFGSLTEAKLVVSLGID